MSVNLRQRLRDFFQELQVRKSLKHYSAQRFEPRPLTVEYLLEPTPEERLRITIATLCVPEKPVSFTHVTRLHWSRTANQRPEVRRKPEDATTVSFDQTLPQELPAAIPQSRVSLGDVRRVLGLPENSPTPENLEGQSFEHYEPNLDRYLGAIDRVEVRESLNGYPVIRFRYMCKGDAALFMERYGKFVLDAGFISRCERLGNAPIVAFEDVVLLAQLNFGPSENGLLFLELREDGTWAYSKPKVLGKVVAVLPGILTVRDKKKPSTVSVDG